MGRLPARPVRLGGIPSQSFSEEAVGAKNCPMDAPGAAMEHPDLPVCKASKNPQI